jgi:cell division septation protein DedD
MTTVRGGGGGGGEAVAGADTRRVGRLACALVAAAFSLAPSVRLSGQNDPRLRAALVLVQSGRADSARALVRRLLATLPPQDSVYPEALYTQGMIAPDAASAATSLQRVVVEYGWSPWADDALLRLAQLNYAQGDPAGAAQTAERLRRDYPDSPLKARADFWGARGYFDLRDEPHGCVLIQEALSGAGEDVEFRNQVSYYAARCGGTAAAPPAAAAPATGTPVPAASSSPAPSPSPTAPPPAPVAPGTVPAPGDSAKPAAPVAYTVQVLAVKSAAQVDELLTRLKVMGFADAHVVRDTSGFLKVRVGRFLTRQDAQRVQQRLRIRLGGQPFVVEEP